MDKIKEHEKICENLNKIYKTKNHDYGDSFGETYKKLGIISAVTRLTDKVNRLQSLCIQDQQVKDESILKDQNEDPIAPVEIFEGKWYIKED